ncbi:MAG: Gfo/Idh/MocA family oxidoreductase [Candidatus Thorarchaeota archaeon]
MELIIAGAGDRGTIYATYALEHPDKARVVGVAEPREFHRERLVKAHAIPEDNVFTDWTDMADRKKFADAVIIATQGSMHREPAIAFANKGYDILLEKPMAPDEESCRQSELVEHEISKSGSIQEIEEIPDDIKRIFKTAHEINPEWHVRMQAAFQRYTENAVSKTVNLPKDASTGDVEKIFLLADELRLKGITVFRDGCLDSQVLYAGCDTCSL